MTLFLHFIVLKQAQAAGVAGSQIFSGCREWIAVVFQVTPSRISWWMDG